jgi:hypothetical protein
LRKFWKSDTRPALELSPKFSSFGRSSLKQPLEISF